MKGRTGEPGNDGQKGEQGPPGYPGRPGSIKTLKNATRVNELLRYIANFKSDFYQCCFGLTIKSHVKRAVRQIASEMGEDTNDTMSDDAGITDDLDDYALPCKYYVYYEDGDTCNYYFQYCPFTKGPLGYSGPQGPRGDTGIQGYAGPKGDDGADGSPGAKGPKGKIGPPGEQGPDGEDFYLYCPTQGPKGPKGIHGRKGVQGVPGRPGSRGPRGDACPPSYGPDGAPGIPGYPGVPGKKGQPGIHGPPGRKGDAAEGDISEQELIYYKLELKKLADKVATGKCCHVPKY